MSENLSQVFPNQLDYVAQPVDLGSSDRYPLLRLSKALLHILLQTSYLGRIQIMLRDAGALLVVYPSQEQRRHYEQIPSEIR